MYRLCKMSDDGSSRTQKWTAEALSQASYKDLGTPAEVEARFTRHLLKSCRSSLETLLTSTSTNTRDFSIPVDTFSLLEEDPVLGQLLLRYPATLLPLLVNAVVTGQNEVLQELSNSVVAEDYFASLSVKGWSDHGVSATRVHARLIHLPPFCCQTSLSNMQASDVGKILQVSGTVVRTNPVQMYESTRTYKCCGKNGCKRHFVVHADMEQRQNILQTPRQCPLQLETGEACLGKTFTIVEGGSVHTDFQEIKIQQAASSLAVGHIPRSLLVKLQHDLVDTCQPGDEVVVVGSLLAQWYQPVLQPGVDCQLGVALSAHSVRVVQGASSSSWQQPSTGVSASSSNNNNNSVGQMEQYRKEFEMYWSSEESRAKPIQARDYICQAVCPKLYGMKIIKLALLLTLVGGVSTDVHEETECTDENVNSNTAAGLVVIPEDQGDQGPVPFPSHAAVSGGENRTDHTSFDGGNETARKKTNRREIVKTRRRDQSHLLLVGDPGTGTNMGIKQECPAYYSLSLSLFHCFRKVSVSTLCGSIVSSFRFDNRCRYYFCRFDMCCCP